MIRSTLGIAERDIDKVLLPIIFVIIVVSALPAIHHMYQENRDLIHRKVGERFGRRPSIQPDARPD
jgi:hypothetical protein